MKRFGDLVSLFGDLVSLSGDLVSLFGDLVSLFGDLVSLFGDLVSLSGDLVSLFLRLSGSTHFRNPYAPWDWNIYLWLKFMMHPWINMTLENHHVQ